ncbi:MAG: hypothetical protein ACLTKE_02595 [Coprococcus sp.]
MWKRKGWEIIQTAAAKRSCRRGEEKVEKNLNEWRYRAEVEIPPRKQSGFQEEILIREEILPLNKKNHWTGKAYVIRMRTDEKMEVKKSPFIIGKSAGREIASFTEIRQSAEGMPHC